MNQCFMADIMGRLELFSILSFWQMTGQSFGQTGAELKFGQGFTKNHKQISIEFTAIINKNCYK